MFGWNVWKSPAAPFTSTSESMFDRSSENSRAAGSGCAHAVHVEEVAVGVGGQRLLGRDAPQPLAVPGHRTPAPAHERVGSDVLVVAAAEANGRRVRGAQAERDPAVRQRFRRNVTGRAKAARRRAAVRVALRKRAPCAGRRRRAGWRRWRLLCENPARRQDCRGPRGDHRPGAVHRSFPFEAVIGSVRRERRVAEGPRPEPRRLWPGTR